MAGFTWVLRGFWAPIRGDLQVYDPIGGRLAYARPSLDCVDASYIWLYAVFTGMRTLLRSFMSMYNYSYYSTSFYQTLTFSRDLYILQRISFFLKLGKMLETLCYDL